MASVFKTPLVSAKALFASTLVVGMASAIASPALAQPSINSLMSGANADNSPGFVSLATGVLAGDAASDAQGLAAVGPAAYETLFEHAFSVAKGVSDLTGRSMGMSAGRVFFESASLEQLEEDTAEVQALVDDWSASLNPMYGLAGGMGGYGSCFDEFGGYSCPRATVNSTNMPGMAVPPAALGARQTYAQQPMMPYAPMQVPMMPYAAMPAPVMPTMMPPSLMQAPMMPAMSSPMMGGQFMAPMATTPFLPMPTYVPATTLIQPSISQPATVAAAGAVPQPSPTQAATQTAPETMMSDGTMTSSDAQLKPHLSVDSSETKQVAEAEKPTEPGTDDAFTDPTKNFDEFKPISPEADAIIKPVEPFKPLTTVPGVAKPQADVPKSRFGRFVQNTRDRFNRTDKPNGQPIDADLPASTQVGSAQTLRKNYDTRAYVQPVMISRQSGGTDADLFETVETGYAVLAGVERAASENLSLGASVAWIDTDSKMDYVNADASLHSVVTTAYGHYEGDRFFGELKTNYGYTSSEVNRDIEFSTYDYETKSDVALGSWGLSGKVGTDVLALVGRKDATPCTTCVIRDTDLRPYAGFDVTYAWLRDDVSEEMTVNNATAGDEFALALSQSGTWNYGAELGLEADTSIVVRNSILVPNAGIAYRYDFHPEHSLEGSYVSDSGTAEANSSFANIARDLSASTLKASLGLEFVSNRAIDAYLRYDASIALSGDVKNQQSLASFGVRVNF